MKKIKYIFLIIFLLATVTSCGVHQGGVNRLVQGMSKSEVNSVLGYPDRSLAVNYYADGTQEVFEYAMSRNEVYAVEFWNGGFVGYERIYLNNNDPIYILPSRPSYPGHINRPGSNNRPGGNNRPGNNTGRPNTGGNRPNTTKPETLPAQPTRPNTRDVEVKTQEADSPTSRERTPSND